jgi:polysaccharide export outer membrane protein
VVQVQAQTQTQTQTQSPAQGEWSPHPGRLAPASIVPSVVEGGAISVVGPGDTLYMTVYGQPELAAQVTVGAEGDITVPFLGAISAGGQSPSAIGRAIALGLEQKGYLRNPQVSIEVVKVRSRIASVLGEVERPGRYPLEGQISLLELLAMAGGAKTDAADVAVVLRRNKDQPPTRLEVRIANRQAPGREIEDLSLQPGDVIYVVQVPRFYVYGEVNRAGAYPLNADFNVMRALSVAGGVTGRGSERRIELRRTDPKTGEVHKMRAQATDPILPGDVIYVDERLF